MHHCHVCTDRTISAINGASRYRIKLPTKQMWKIFARDNMEVPVKIKENVSLRIFEVSGKKRNS